MADVTVTQFADVLKVPVERLLAQLGEAGIPVSGAEATISDEAKMELLTFLRRSHGRGTSPGASPPKITCSANRRARSRWRRLRAAPGPSTSKSVPRKPI